MRLIKSMALAAIAMCALVAFAGATTASATRLCSVSTSPCPSGNVYPSGTTINGTVNSAGAVLATSGGLVNPTITCTASTNTLQSTSAGGGSGVAITGNLTALSFSSCTDNLRSCGTSGTVTGLPSPGSVSWTGSPGAFDGSLTVGPNLPSVTFTCRTGTTSFNCTFGGSSSVTGQVTGGLPARVSFNRANIPIAAGSGAQCPRTASWTATYNSTSTTNGYWLTDS